jgi:hypothetical protein
VYYKLVEFGDAVLFGSDNQLTATCSRAMDHIAAVLRYSTTARVIDPCWSSSELSIATD